MADKSISDLTQATQIQALDLFVLEQGGEAKKLLGETLTQYLANVNTNSITSVVFDAQNRCVITLTDGTVITSPSLKGQKGDAGAYVDRIERTSGTGAAGTTDTYTMYSSENTVIGTFDVYNGADGTGGGTQSTTQTITLTTSGWAQSGSRYYQTKSVTGVTASTPVVLVDVALTGSDLDADAEALEAWGIVSSNNVSQGNGTLTFYALTVPSVNIPVNVGVC